MSVVVPHRTSAGRVLKSPLKVTTRGPVLERRPDLRSYVELRLLSVLGHLARRVDCVAVTGDTLDGGPGRGGIRCRLWARLVSGRELREEHVDADPFASIDGVTEALARDVEYLESRFPSGPTHRCA
jgi:hypothetical protein